MNTTTTPARPRPNIRMIPVESSHMKAYGYDRDTRTLAIQFADRGDKPGPTYHYADVPAVLWSAFCDCESKGAFFQRMIRAQADKHPPTKVEPAEQQG